MSTSTPGVEQTFVEKRERFALGAAASNDFAVSQREMRGVAAHSVKTYDDELRTLEMQIAHMGGLAEQALGRAIDALCNRDPDLAEETLENDRVIDELEQTVDELAISVIARRAPLASDLRQIVTAIRIAADLERIGDLSKNIAKRAIIIAPETHPKQLMTGFFHIGETALRQLKDVLDAYSQRDADLAMRVWQQDQDIDAIYNSLYHEILATMTEDSSKAGVYAHLLFAAKNLERIGDHATNIAETVFFLTEGRLIGQPRPKLDTTSHALLARNREASR